MIQELRTFHWDLGQLYHKFPKSAQIFVYPFKIPHSQLVVFFTKKVRIPEKKCPGSQIPVSRLFGTLYRWRIFAGGYSWEDFPGRIFPGGYSREDIPGRIFPGGYYREDIPGRIFPGGYSREDIPGSIFPGGYLGQLKTLTGIIKTIQEFRTLHWDLAQLYHQFPKSAQIFVYPFKIPNS